MNNIIHQYNFMKYIIQKKRGGKEYEGWMRQRDQE